MSQTKRELQPEHNLAPEHPDNIQPFDRDPDYDIPAEPLPQLTLNEDYDVHIHYPSGGDVRLCRGRDEEEGKRLFRVARLAFNLGAGFGKSAAARHLDRVEHYFETQWPAPEPQPIQDVDDAF